MEEHNFTVLVDAKVEYTNQLITILKPTIYQGIKSIYEDSKSHCQENDNINNTLVHFQLLLSLIPKWNQEIINEETKRIMSESGCDWLDDLITAVFVSHTRILTTINNSKQKKRIDLKIPKVSHFIHKCYIDVARLFWKNAYLFNENISKSEFQRNRRESENIIEASINETVRRQLPVKHILKEYLGNQYDDSDEASDISEKHRNDLKKMVKMEINNCSKEKLEKFKEGLGLDTAEIKDLDTAVIKDLDTAVIKDLDTAVIKDFKHNSSIEDDIFSDGEVSDADIEKLVDDELKLESVDISNNDLTNLEKNINIYDNELNSIDLTNSDNLIIDELSLDDMDDLNNLQECYFNDELNTLDDKSNLETKIPNIDNNIEYNINNNKSNLSDISSVQNGNIKRIKIEPNTNDKTNKDKILNKYSKKRNYSFFD